MNFSPQCWACGAPAPPTHCRFQLRTMRRPWEDSNPRSAVRFQLLFEILSLDVHRALQIFPIVADDAPIDHRRLAAGRSRRQAVGDAAGGVIVLVGTDDGNRHSEDESKQGRHGCLPRLMRTMERVCEAISSAEMAR